jgi:hypothetical protein
MKLKKTHIFIAVIAILLLNVTSANALDRFFTPQKENTTIEDQVQPLVSNPYQSAGSDLQDFDLITEQEGWVLLGQNVYWTSDGGRRWENITPAGSAP